MRLGLGLGLLLLRLRAARQQEDSRRVDAPELQGAPSPGDATEGLLQQALGRPYVWGGGRAPGTWPQGSATSASGGVAGYDCSGYVDAALRELGADLPWGQGSASVAAMTGALPLQGGEPPAWSVAVYGQPGRASHVMLVAPGGRVYGASGGGSATHGQDPEARVTSYASYTYRGDYLGWLWPW